VETIEFPGQCGCKERKSQALTRSVSAKDTNFCRARMGFNEYKRNFFSPMDDDMKAKRFNRQIEKNCQP
jgi:hypothetical protein